MFPGAMIGSGWLVTQIVPLRLEGRGGGLSGSYSPPRLGGKKSLPEAQDSRGSHLFNEAVVLDNGAKVRDPVSTEHVNKQCHHLLLDLWWWSPDPFLMVEAAFN